MDEKIKKQGIPFLILLILTFYFYSPLFNGFFQQDEWFSYALYVINKNLSLIDSLKLYFAPSVGHYNPLTNMLQFNIFSLWGMNYTNFAIIGIILHLIVVITLFITAKIIFKGNNLLAFLVALLFAVFASPYQGTAWVVADMSTLISSFFGLVSLIFFLKFLQNNKANYLIWSLSVLIISLLFKEITIGLFALYFIYYLLTYKGKHKFKYIWLIVVFGGIYLLFRISMIFAPNTTGDQLVTQSQSFKKIIYNFLTIPIKSISQIIIPPEFMKIVSFIVARRFPDSVTGGYGSPQFELFAVKKVMEFLNMFVGLVTLAFGIFLFKKNQKANFRNVILLGLSWVILNSFIFSFAPENPGVIFVIDSRNLYFTSIGISFFIVSLINLVSRKNSIKIILFILPILLFNVYWLNSNLSKFVEVGKVRRSILEQITYLYPILSDKVVFYTISDTSYYGLPENEKIFPFQSGFGQTLLAWYEPRENFPTDFFEKRFLWDIKSQGYKEVRDRGFGYFRDYTLLYNTISERKINVNEVIAFSFNSRTETLVDITTEIRKRLSDQNLIQSAKHAK